jgi:hypothetical protein
MTHYVRSTRVKGGGANRHDVDHVKNLLSKLDHYRLISYDPDKVQEIEAELAAIRKSLVASAKQNQQEPSTTTFVPYPDIDDPQFFIKLFNKKEFRKNEYEDVDVTKSFDDLANEKCGQRTFHLTKNQVFLKNFMSPNTSYNSLLLFHSVGVGKSCTAISIAEQFRKIYAKKILVLMPTNLKDNFKKQIFDINKINQCTGLKYFRQITDDNMPPERTTLGRDILEKRANRLIHDTYEFLGFQEFANIVQKLQGSGNNEQRWIARVREKFSDRVIIIDEVHNVRVGKGADKIVPPKLMDVLKHAQNVKLILLSATPMFNEASEIVWLINLMLANDKRPLLKHEDVFGGDGSLTKSGEALIQETVRGYVSYMRGENPFSFPLRLTPSQNADTNILKVAPKVDIKGIPIPKSSQLSRLEIIGSKMSAWQSKIYELAESKVNDEEVDEDGSDNDEDGKLTGSNTAMLQASNIVFPHPSNAPPFQECIGSSGFQRCFREIKGGKYYKVQYNEDVLAKHGEFLSADNIAKYAPKLKSIIDYIMNSEGVVYVYSFYLQSGIIPLAIALEHMGFTKYGNHNILHNHKTKKANKKGWAYSILTPNKHYTADFDGEIDKIRSEANKNGDVIKVILGSSVSAEGIDFKYIREIHLVEPWYHLNKVEQIVGRAIRNCSHIDLPPAKRNVTVFHHASVLPNRPEETIDLRVYRIAENKQSAIDNVEMILKQSAIDCMLNKRALHFDPKFLNMKLDIITSQGNALSQYIIGDQPGSRFEKYKCMQESSSKVIDDSTYVKDFYVDDIDLYASYIAHLYTKSHVYTYDEIIKNLRDTYRVIDEDIVKFAIEYMINTRYHFINASDNDGYMIYRGNKYIFQPFDSIEQRIAMRQRKSYAKPIVHRLKIDDTYTTNQINDIHIGDNSSSLSSSLAKNKGKNVANSTVPRVDLLSELEKLYTQFLNEEMAFGMDLSQTEVLYNASIDFMVDRLPESTLLLLAKHFCEYKSDKPDKASSDQRFVNSILRSLIEGHILIRQHAKLSSPFKWIRSPYTERIYVVDDSTLRMAKERELKEEFNKASHTHVPITTSFRDLRAYLEIAKDGVMESHKIKIIDPEKPKSEGFVCHGTSTFVLSTLKNNIRGLSKTAPIDKGTKPTLCKLYELLLRAHAPHLFARPILANHLKQQYKDERKVK